MSRATDRLEAAMAAIDTCLDSGTGVTVGDLLAADGPYDPDEFWVNFYNLVPIDRDEWVIARAAWEAWLTSEAPSLVWPRNMARIRAWARDVANEPYFTYDEVRRTLDPDA